MTTIESGLERPTTQDIAEATTEAARIKNVLPWLGKVLNWLAAPQPVTHPHDMRKDFSQNQDKTAFFVHQNIHLGEE